MNGRRNNRARNNELPIPSQAPEAPTPEARIELAPPPDIDIAQDHLGALFTQRRRALGMKIEEIAEDIKVKADYLRAIEQENFDLLPTPEYARLFIKAYAERLGFSLPEVFALLDVSAGMAASAAKPKSAAPQPETIRHPTASPDAVAEAGSPRRRPFVIWGLVVVGAGVLLVVAWIALHNGKSGNQATSTSAPATPSSAPVRRSEPVPPPQEDSLPLPNGDATAEPMNLALQFVRDAWVFLEADHDTVVNRIVRAGERIDASAMESFVLSLGHTDGITTSLNGRTIGPFSTWTRRLNHYSITQDSVRAWLGSTQAGSAEPASGGTQQTRPDTGGTPR